MSNTTNNAKGTKRAREEPATDKSSNKKQKIGADPKKVPDDYLVVEYDKKELKQQMLKGIKMVLDWNDLNTLAQGGSAVPVMLFDGTQISNYWSFFAFYLRIYAEKAIEGIKQASQRLQNGLKIASNWISELEKANDAFHSSMVACIDEHLKKSKELIGKLKGSLAVKE